MQQKISDKKAQIKPLKANIANLELRIDLLEKSRDVSAVEVLEGGVPLPDRLPVMLPGQRVRVLSCEVVRLLLQEHFGLGVAGRFVRKLDQDVCRGLRVVGDQRDCAVCLLTLFPRKRHRLS